MKKLKIAFFISDMQAGGAQRVAAVLCSHWAHQDHDVTLMTINSTASKDECFYDLHDDISFQPLKRPNPESKGKLSINIQKVRAIRSACLSIKPDIVVSFMTENNILCLLGCVDLKNTPLLISERADPKVYPEVKIWRVLRRALYPFADALVCQTDEAGSFFKNYRNMRVVPNPVPQPDTSHIKDKALPDHFVVGLGRLGHEKGFDLLIKAFQKIHHEMPDYHLLLIGDGPELEQYEHFITRKKANDAIHLLGQKSDPFPILEHADLFVLPSRTEGFPNALCEAMLLGRPAVISDVVAQKLNFLEDGKNCVVFRTGDVEDLAQKIKDILNDTELRQTLAEAGKHAAQKYLSAERVFALWDQQLAELSA